MLPKEEPFILMGFFYGINSVPFGTISECVELFSLMDAVELCSLALTEAPFLGPSVCYSTQPLEQPPGMYEFG